jgi:hypothetical protein
MEWWYTNTINYSFFKKSRFNVYISHRDIWRRNRIPKWFKAINYRLRFLSNSDAVIILTDNSSPDCLCTYMYVLVYTSIYTYVCIYMYTYIYLSPSLPLQFRCCSNPHGQFLTRLSFNFQLKWIPHINTNFGHYIPHTIASLAINGSYKITTIIEN